MQVVDGAVQGIDDPAAARQVRRVAVDGFFRQDAVLAEVLSQLAAEKSLHRRVGGGDDVEGVFVSEGEITLAPLLGIRVGQVIRRPSNQAEEPSGLLCQVGWVLHRRGLYRCHGSAARELPRRSAICHHASAMDQPISTAPPRILTVTTTYPRDEGDHTPRFVADLCEHLVADHGMQVTVLAPHGPGLERSQILRGVRVERFRYALDPSRQAIAYGAGITDNLRDVPRARWQLPAFVTSLLAATLRRLPEHDLVHAHWAPPGALVGLANLIHRRPSVLTLHRLSVPCSRLERFALRRADRVLFNSRFTQRQVEAQGCRCRGEVVYQGFDQGMFRPGSVEGESLRRRLAIPAQAPLVVAVARLVSFKGFHVLLEAAESFLAHRPTAHLVIAGEGPEGERLSSRAAASKFAARIHLPGPLRRRDVVRLFAAADVFVNPGIDAPQGFVETLGIAALEAAAMGVPGVGTRVGGIPETIIDGETGLLVAPSDAAALADAIGALLDDGARRRALGEAARRRVEQCFSWRHLASEVAKIYGQLLVAGGRS